MRIDERNTSPLLLLYVAFDDINYPLRFHAYQDVVDGNKNSRRNLSSQ